MPKTLFVKAIWILIYTLISAIVVLFLTDLVGCNGTDIKDVDGGCGIDERGTECCERLPPEKQCATDKDCEPDEYCNFGAHACWKKFCTPDCAGWQCGVDPVCHSLRCGNCIHMNGYMQQCVEGICVPICGTYHVEQVF